MTVIIFSVLCLACIGMRLFAPTDMHRATWAVLAAACGLVAVILTIFP